MPAFSAPAIATDGTAQRSTQGHPSGALSCVPAIDVLQRFGSTDAAALGSAEQAALSLLYMRYSAMVRGVAGKILGAADAEDVLHDIFARLPWLICQYRHGGFGGWLRQVATRSALMRLRRSNRIDVVSRLPERPVEPVELAEDRGQLSRAIDALPLALREVVVLRFFLDLTHEEIGQLLEISRNASEVRLCRALKQLRAQLRESAGRTPSLLAAAG